MSVSKIPSNPTETLEPLYPCRNTNFGAYLIAANLLRYKCAELASNGKDVDLLFYDPDARGPALLHRYNAGAAELVNARTLYEVRGFLLSEVTKVQRGGRHGKDSR